LEILPWVEKNWNDISCPWIHYLTSSLCSHLSPFLGPKEKCGRLGLCNAHIRPLEDWLRGSRQIVAPKHDFPGVYKLTIRKIVFELRMTYRTFWKRKQTPLKV
jgi:hypothetical protein